MLRRFIFALTLLVGSATSLFAQMPPREIQKGKVIVSLEDKISLETLDVENQSQSGTCWSFGVTALFESDIIAKGGTAVNLSDMWIVRNMYFDKVVKYVRLHGTSNLTVGGAMHDVVEGVKRYGLVPEVVYPGLNYGESSHNFVEIDAVLKGYADAVISTGRPSAVWERGLNALLDNYFGARIASFEFEGVSYTPKTYAESLGLDMNNYISICSFMSLPYGKMVELDIPDNWLGGRAYNIPIDELMDIMERVLERGRSFGLAVDITEEGFKTFNGVAVIPSTPELKEQRWDYIQRRRQIEFNNYSTTDDHCVQIMGRAEDREGNIYYKAKNSWGKLEPYDGFFYFSRDYIELKAILIMVDRTLLPSNIKKGLGLN